MANAVLTDGTQHNAFGETLALGSNHQERGVARGCDEHRTGTAEDDSAGKDRGLTVLSEDRGHLLVLGPLRVATRSVNVYTDGIAHAGRSPRGDNLDAAPAQIALAQYEPECGSALAASVDADDDARGDPFSSSGSPLGLPLRWGLWLDPPSGPPAMAVP